MLYAIWFLVLFSAGAYCAYRSAKDGFRPGFTLLSLILVAGSIWVTWPVFGKWGYDYLDMALPNKGESVHELTVKVLIGIACLSCAVLPLEVACRLTKKSNQSGGLTNSQENLKASE